MREGKLLFPYLKREETPFLAARGEIPLFGGGSPRGMGRFSINENAPLRISRGIENRQPGGGVFSKALPFRRACCGSGELGGRAQNTAERAGGYPKPGSFSGHSHAKAGSARFCCRSRGGCRSRLVLCASGERVLFLEVSYGERRAEGEVAARVGRACCGGDCDRSGRGRDGSASRAPRAGGGTA